MSAQKEETLPRVRARRGHMSDDVIATAISGSLGNVAFIARRLGVSRMTVWRRISSSERLKELFDEENETMLDNAENELLSLMNPSVNEDPRSRLDALKYYLDCKGKHRGYGRQPIDVNLGVNQAPIVPVLTFAGSEEQVIGAEKNYEEQV